MYLLLHSQYVVPGTFLLTSTAAQLSVPKKAEIEVLSQHDQADEVKERLIQEERWVQQREQEGEFLH